MMNYDEMTPGQLLADLNVAEFVKQLALGIAEAQVALDNNSIAQAIKLAETKLLNGTESLLDLGFYPVFYGVNEATIDVSMHLSFRVEKSFSWGVGINANYGQPSGSEKGTGTITVKQEEGSPAKGVVKLMKTDVGEFTVGSKLIKLVDEVTPIFPKVAIEKNNIGKTADNLIAVLVPANVPEIEKADKTIVEGDEITLEAGTGATGIFVCTKNKIQVKQEEGVAVADALVIKVGETDFTTKADGPTPLEFAPGADAAATAQALADAIVAELSIEAWVEDDTVHLTPEGSYVEITMTTVKKQKAADGTTLTPDDGTFSLGRVFTGGADGVDPISGSVTIGSTTFSCAENPAGKQFKKGATAKETAENLKALIESTANFEESTVLENVVTVKGPVKATLKTSNEKAFAVSGSMLEGEAPPPIVDEKNVPIAVGATFDMRQSRQFGIEVGGNSHINVKLLTLPAPAKLLDRLKKTPPG